MNQTTHRLAGIALIALAGAVSAQEATPDHWIGDAGSLLARADVRAEAAGAAGNGMPVEMSFMQASAGGVMRADVLADLSRSRASGEYASINGEAQSFGPAPQRPALYAATRRP